MHTKTSLLGTKPWRSIGAIATAMIVAFGIGIATSDSVRPVIPETQADDVIVAGDMNRNGTLEYADASIAISLARGDRTPTPAELLADPNTDYHITLEDVEAILWALEHSPSHP